MVTNVSESRPHSIFHFFLVAYLLLLFISLSPASTRAGSQTFSGFSPQDLKLLGVVTPQGEVFAQETYKGITFLATRGNRYTEDQLALLKYFIDRVPAALLKDGPSAIVNAKTGYLPSLAQASGPYVYFKSNAFRTGGFWSAGSLEGVFRGFVHELVHVYQFRKAVRTIDFKKAREKFQRLHSQTLWDFAVMKTPLIQSFADVTGWRLHKGPITTARLKDFRTEKTSNYGRVSIMEDMAETVSFVVIGDLSPLSRGRVQWAVKLLGYASLKPLLHHTFPYSDRLEPVSMGSSATRFDVSKKKAYKRRYRVTDIAHFVGKAKDHYREIVSALKRGFRDRGWENTLSRELRLKGGVKKYLLEYRGKWRDVYLEVISYEDAKGYLIKPEKTIVTILSGYRL